MVSHYDGLKDISDSLILSSTFFAAFLGTTLTSALSSNITPSNEPPYNHGVLKYAYVSFGLFLIALTIGFGVKSILSQIPGIEGDAREEDATAGYRPRMACISLLVISFLFNVVALGLLCSKVICGQRGVGVDDSDGLSIGESFCQGYSTAVVVVVGVCITVILLIFWWARHVHSKPVPGRRTAVLVDIHEKEKKAVETTKRWIEDQLKLAEKNTETYNKQLAAVHSDASKIRRQLAYASTDLDRDSKAVVDCKFAISSKKPEKKSQSDDAKLKTTEQEFEATLTRVSCKRRKLMYVHKRPSSRRHSLNRSAKLPLCTCCWVEYKSD